MGGGTIFPRRPRTTGNKNCFQPRPKNFFFNIVFPKFDPLTASGGDSLRDILFFHWPYLHHNGARERSIIQFIDLLSHWLSLRVIRGTEKQFLDVEFRFYIFVYKHLEDRSGDQY